MNPHRNDEDTIATGPWLRRFSRRLVIALVALASLVVSGPVLAAPILEAEPLFDVENDQLLLAEAIPGSAFTTPVPHTAFGSYATATITGDGGTGDVDFYSFFTNLGQGYFDIDHDPFTFNLSLSLFDPSGTLIGFADDHSHRDLGTVDDRDPFLGVYTFTTAGTYYLAVSAAPNQPNGRETFGSLFTPLLRPDGTPGGFAITGAAAGDSSFDYNGGAGDGSSAAYTLHLSLQSPVTDAAPIPEPATLLLFGTGLAAGVRRYRQRQK